MSVNDGLSDSEWGAWGKSDDAVVIKNIDSINPIHDGKRIDNGFGSDDEINVNGDSNENSSSKFSSSKFNGGGGGGGGRFQSKRDDDNDNRNKRSYNNNRDNGYNNNHKDGYNKDNYNNRNNNNNNSDFKRNNSYNNNDRNDKSSNYQNRNKTNDYGNRNNERNNRDDYRKRDESDERRPSNRYRDDSGDRRNNYRKKDDFKRDDSRDNSRFHKRDRRDDSDDSRDRYMNRSNRDNESSRFDNRRKNDRDESKENRRKIDDRYRDDDDDDDSRGNRRKYRDDSRENRRKPNDDRYKRDDSRENRRKYRDDSREKPSERFREYRRQNGDDSADENDRNRYKNDYLSNKFEKSMKFNKNDDGFDRDDDNEFGGNRKEGFSSRTFIRGKKPELDNAHKEMNDDSAAIPKRATFIPDDDQEDYKLHVNSGINFDNYDKIPVDVTGENAPGPITSFNELDLPQFLTDNIRDMKYVKLTPVQKYAVPIIDVGRDLMACAQTGSGKTAAFLIPIIKGLNSATENHDDTGNPNGTTSTAFPRALIMTPTRELCRQIFTAAKLLCRGSNIRCAYMYGGIEMNKSRRNIQATGCDILVATPGRLIHFLELVWVSLRYIKYFVLDEADRMLDEEGFYEVVNKIYKEAHQSGDSDRSIHLSMFSATFPNEIQTLASKLLKNYLFLAVGVVGSANCDVKQEIIRSDQREKVNSAIELIKTIPEEKTLIFVESKRMADFFGIKLGYLGFKATTIHGDREQEQRESALNDFKSGRVNFMVATNVAARGLDIPKVDNVINIDMPDTIDTYVHRIGRTGRCGNVGRAISFFDDMKDIGLAGPLVSKLQEANQEVEQWLRDLAAGSVGAINVPRYANNSRDTRKNVKINKYIDNPNEQDDDDAAGGGGFMRGTNVDYDDSPAATSEWLEE